MSLLLLYFVLCCCCKCWKLWYLLLLLYILCLIVKNTVHLRLLKATVEWVGVLVYNIFMSTPITVYIKLGVFNIDKGEKNLQEEI